MCQQNPSTSQRPSVEEEEEVTSRKPSDNFPWIDAHCHPTDTMPSIASIPKMRTRTLTIMATRSQDQELVGAAASEHGMRLDDILALSSATATGHHTLSEERKVVAAFGWHPWFSYQLYDDTVPVANRTYDLAKVDKVNPLAEKMRHFASVLSPAPKGDDFAAHMPDLKALSEFIQETRQRLLKYPTAIVGEVGLDKVFRLPQPWKDDEKSERDSGLTPGGREGRLLTSHRVNMAHQQKVLKAQLKLAAEMNRPVSVHGVQAHGVLFDTLAECWKGHEREVMTRKQRRQVAHNAEDFSSSSEDEGSDEEMQSSLSELKLRGKKDQANTTKEAESKPPTSKPYPPRICLHSFSGPVQVLKQYMDPKIPADIYFSFSTAVNFSTATSISKSPEVIAACPDDRLLVESDLHAAGDQMDAALEDMYRKVCEIKGWDLAEGVKRIASNYENFIRPAT